MLFLHGEVGLKLKFKNYKQNKTEIGTIFFASTCGKNIKNAFPLMNLLDILSVTSSFKLQVLKFAHRWHSKALPSIFNNYFQYANVFMVIIRDMPVIENSLPFRSIRRELLISVRFCYSDL